MNRYVLLGILGVVILGMQSAAHVIAGHNTSAYFNFIISGMFAGFAIASWKDK